MRAGYWPAAVKWVLLTAKVCTISLSMFPCRHGRLKSQATRPGTRTVVIERVEPAKMVLPGPRSTGRKISSDAANRRGDIGKSCSERPRIAVCIQDNNVAERIRSGQSHCVTPARSANFARHFSASSGLFKDS